MPNESITPTRRKSNEAGTSAAATPVARRGSSTRPRMKCSTAAARASAGSPFVEKTDEGSAIPFAVGVHGQLWQEPDLARDHVAGKATRESRRQGRGIHALVGDERGDSRSSAR